MNTRTSPALEPSISPFRPSHHGLSRGIGVRDHGDVGAAKPNSSTSRSRQPFASLTQPFRPLDVAYCYPEPRRIDTDVPEAAGGKGAAPSRRDPRQAVRPGPRSRPAQVVIGMRSWRLVMAMSRLKHRLARTLGGPSEGTDGASLRCAGSQRARVQQPHRLHAPDSRSLRPHAERPRCVPREDSPM